MRTEEERLALLHARADALRRRRDRNVLTALGGVSFGLCICLFAVMADLNGTAHPALGGQFAGASLLGDLIGGYVLVAVLSFAAAVILTLICIRRQEREKKHGHEETEEDQQTQKKHQT